MGVKFDQAAATAYLKENTEAQQYLLSRGISLTTAVKHKLGVYNFPSFGPCIAIPYATGDVKFRAINAKDKDRFRALGEPNDKLFGIEAIDADLFEDADKLLVVESELDCITAREALDQAFIVVSVPSATACVSRNGQLTIDPEHLNKLRRFRGEILVATDQDKAGEACANAFRKTLGGKTKRLTWDWKTAKDIGELHTKYGKEFPNLIKQLCEESQVPLLWKQAPSFANIREKQYEWIVPDLVPADNVVLITGDFGSFKSYLSYFLADAISGGEKFVQRQCRQHPVLILDRENGHSTVYLRKKLVGGLNTRQNVKILGLFTEPTAPEITDDRLLDVCASIKPVIIIDSLIDFHSGKKESDADDMTEVFQNIRNLITTGAAAVIVLHHTPKTGSGSAGAYRGSTAIAGAVSGAILIKKGEKYTATLKSFKTRDGEDRDIKIKLRFGLDAVTYEVLDAGRGSEADLRDQIEQHVQQHDGCTRTEAAKAVGKRRKTVFETIKAMIRTGGLSKDARGHLHSPPRKMQLTVPEDGSGQAEPALLRPVVPPEETMCGTGQSEALQDKEDEEDREYSIGSGSWELTKKDRTGSGGGYLNNPALGGGNSFVMFVQKPNGEGSGENDFD